MGIAFVIGDKRVIRKPRMCWVFWAVILLSHSNCLKVTTPGVRRFLGRLSDFRIKHYQKSYSNH